MNLLTRAAYRLSLAGLEQFTVQQLADSTGSSSASLLLEHEILIKDSQGRLGEINIARYRFLHLTFQEYLTARGLSQQNDWLETALTHLYNPTWQEVLRLLGQSLDANRPYAARQPSRVHLYVDALLRSNEGDLLCRPLLLAMLIAAEARDGTLPAPLTAALEKLSVQCWGHSGHWLPREYWTPALVCWGNRVLHLIIPSLKARSWYIRSNALEAIGEIGGPDAKSLSVSLLTDQEASVRRTAAETLVTIGASEAIPNLIALFDDSSPDLYSYIPWAVSRLGGKDLTSSLVGLLNDRRATVRQAAAQALGAPNNNEAVPALLHCSTTNPRRCASKPWRHWGRLAIKTRYRQYAPCSQIRIT